MLGIAFYIACTGVRFFMAEPQVLVLLQQRIRVEAAIDLLRCHIKVDNGAFSALDGQGGDVGAEILGALPVQGGWRRGALLAGGHFVICFMKKFYGQNYSYFQIEL